MSMGGHDLTATTAETYRAFALEAAGRSPQYERLSTEVADDDAILSFLASLPPAKRQPNLLFAAARSLLGAPPEPESLRSLVADGGQELAFVMRTRRTQTNEPARCATLLPLLAMGTERRSPLDVTSDDGRRRCVALRESLLRAHARRPWPGGLHRRPRHVAPLASGAVGRGRPGG